MKIVFTPHTGDFENAYKKRIEFEKIEEMIKYLIDYQKKVFQLDTIKSQYFIEWYAFSEHIKRDRFIIIFKKYTTKETLRYPIGFFHYEKKIIKPLDKLL